MLRRLFALLARVFGQLAGGVPPVERPAAPAVAPPTFKAEVDRAGAVSVQVKHVVRVEFVRGEVFIHARDVVDLFDATRRALPKLTLLMPSTITDFLAEWTRDVIRQAEARREEAAERQADADEADLEVLDMTEHLRIESDGVGAVCDLTPHEAARLGRVLTEWASKRSR